MDMKDTPEEAAFRTDVRAWLTENAAQYGMANIRKTYLSEDVDEALKRAKEWQAKKADAGYSCMTWPTEFGGRGATTMQAVIYREEEARYAVPRGFFEIGQGMAGPTMMKYATDEQNKEHMPPMLRGENVWCQLFSEPAAGSDLAGLRTRADQDGDDWIINGQKVWTSGAHYSDWGIMVTRHDPTIPKHQGLTYFFLDMKSPGIEIRRIKQISGGSNFCEVYFTDVRIPDSQRLGGIGDGWSVSLTTLMNERLAVGTAPPPDADDLFALAKEQGALKNADVRSKIADWYVQMTGLKYTKARTMTALSRGQTPGPEASIEKLVSASKQQDIGSFGMDIEDMAGILMDSPQDALYQNGFMAAPGFRIAGGTDEILRNIISERVLGLPPEIRVDKRVSFAELATGAT
jgi:alkylation response protein AidB-like acyl-CoA dehydrogenase